MLARYGVQGANTWVQVVSTLLSGVQEGWGKWAEGVVEPESESEDEKMDIDSGSDNESPTKSLVIMTKRKLRRTPLPKNVSSKLLLLGSSSHISTLADLLVSSQGALSEFANFTLGLLTAFKGSPRWEAILDGLLEGRKGVALARRMWREGVRGKWGIARDQSSWQNFTSSTSSFVRFVSMTDPRPVNAMFDPNDPSILSLPPPHSRRRVLRPNQSYQPIITR
jgi:ubiquitin-protein ligase E3 C